MASVLSTSLNRKTETYIFGIKPGLDTLFLLSQGPDFTYSSLFEVALL